MWFCSVSQSRSPYIDVPPEQFDWSGSEEKKGRLELQPRAAVAANQPAAIKPAANQAAAKQPDMVVAAKQPARAPAKLLLPAAARFCLPGKLPARLQQVQAVLERSLLLLPQEQGLVQVRAHQGPSSPVTQPSLPAPCLPVSTSSQQETSPGQPS